MNDKIPMLIIDELRKQARQFRLASSKLIQAANILDKSHGKKYVVKSSSPKGYGG